MKLIRKNMIYNKKLNENILETFYKKIVLDRNKK